LHDNNIMKASAGSGVRQLTGKLQHVEKKTAEEVGRPGFDTGSREVSKAAPRLINPSLEPDKDGPCDPPATKRVVIRFTDSDTGQVVRETTTGEIPGTWYGLLAVVTWQKEQAGHDHIRWGPDCVRLEHGMESWSMADYTSSVGGLSGLSSGIDWSTIITQLIAVERSPLPRCRQKKPPLRRN